MKLLVQTQLSNIVNGKFDLTADSGWNMCMGRIREMLKQNPELEIDVTCPLWNQLVEGGAPWNTNWDLYATGRVQFIQHYVIPNALATRYNFNFEEMSKALSLDLHKNNVSWKYDAVYINDPLLLKNFKALFHIKAGYQPRFYVHSHFVDCVSNPKFPQEASLWLGQVEATQRADFNFWQCQTAIDEFEKDARKLLKDEVVDEILTKSEPWDDGFSYEEITSPINYGNIRFDVEQFKRQVDGKTVLFVPNRISTGSNDFTRGMKFMFEILPELYKHRQDFVVVAGNPNQKFSNDELEKQCGQFGYLKVGSSSFCRDEYKFIARNSHIVLGMYDVDTYGGTAARECISLGMMPMWANVNEYAKIAKDVDYPFLYNPNFSNFIDTIDALMNNFQSSKEQYLENLQRVVYDRCSYESTTPDAMRKMGLLSVNLRSV